MSLSLLVFQLLLFLVSPGASQTLRGYYPLHGDVYDYSGNNLHGDIIGKITFSNDGTHGQVLDLSETTSMQPRGVSIRVDGTVLVPPTGPNPSFSFTAWVYPTGSTWPVATSSYLAGLYTTKSTGPLFAVLASGPDLILQVEDTGTKTVTATNKLTVNAWNFLAATCDWTVSPNKCFLFVNGVQVASISPITSPNLVYVGQPFTIGFGSTDFTVPAAASGPMALSDIRLFEGRISDVRIYHGEINAATATTLMTTYTPAPDLATNPPLPGGFSLVPPAMPPDPVPAPNACEIPSNFTAAIHAYGSSGSPVAWQSQCFTIKAEKDVLILGYDIVPFQSYGPATGFYEWVPQDLTKTCGELAASHPSTITPYANKWVQYSSYTSPAVRANQSMPLPNSPVPRYLTFQDKTCVCIAHPTWIQATSQYECPSGPENPYSSCAQPNAGYPLPTNGDITLLYSNFTTFPGPGSQPLGHAVRLWVGTVRYILYRSTVGFAFPTISVGEGQVLTATMTRFNHSHNGVSDVRCTSFGGIALGSGFDYNDVDAVYTWPMGTPGDMECAPIGMVIPDGKAEEAETFTLKLTQPTYMTCLGQYTVLTVTIQASQFFSVYFQGAGGLVLESTGFFSFVIKRTGGTGEFSFNLLVATNMTTATPSANLARLSAYDDAFPYEDYIFPQLQTITFKATDTQKTIVVPIIDDTLAEAAEVITLNITNLVFGPDPGGPGPASIGNGIIGGALGGSYVQFTIVANDPMSITMPEFAAPINISEIAASVNVKVSRTGGTGAFTALISYADIEAFVNADYTPAVTSVAFGRTETLKSFSIPLVQDGVPEPAESFKVGVSGLVYDTVHSVANGKIVLGQNEDTITISTNYELDVVWGFKPSATVDIHAQTAAILVDNDLGDLIYMLDYISNSTIVGFTGVRSTPGTNVGILEPGGPRFSQSGPLTANVKIKPAGVATGTATYLIQLLLSCTPNPGCVSSTVLTLTFNVLPALIIPPSVLSVQPSIYKPCGGTVLTATGTFFGDEPANLTGVAVGGSECTSFTWYAVSLIECQTPPTTPGIGTPLTVRTLSGNGSSPMNISVYGYPVVTQMTPTFIGSMQTNISITLTGSDLGLYDGDISSILLAGVPCKTITWKSNSSVVCLPTSTFGKAAAGPVTITSTTGCTKDSLLFNYFQPVISAVVPNAASPELDTITLYGAHFGSSAADFASNRVNLTVGPFPCLEPHTWISDSAVSCIFPPTGFTIGTATYNVSMYTVREGFSIPGKGGSSEVRFKAPQAVIYSAQPDIVQFTNDSVTIKGRYLNYVTSITLAGNVSCTVVSATETEILCLTGSPPEGGKPGPIVIDTNGNGQALSPFDFTFEALPPGPESGIPTITALTPVSGPVEGGTRITIFGYNIGNYFADVSALDVGPASCLDTLEWFSSTRIVCITPPRPSGPGKEHVTMEITRKPNITSNSLNFRANVFTYVLLPATLRSIGPGTVTSDGSMVVTLEGDHFFDPNSFGDGSLPPITLRFGTYVCANLERVSDSRITCHVPPMEDATTNPVVLTVLGQPAKHLVTPPLALRIDDLTAFCFPLCGVRGDCVQTECTEDTVTALGCITCRCKAGFSGPPLCENILYTHELGYIGSTRTRLFVTEDGGIDYIYLYVDTELSGNDVWMEVAVDPPHQVQALVDKVFLTYPDPVVIPITGIADGLRDDAVPFAVLLTPKATSTSFSFFTKMGTLPPIYGIVIDSSPKILSIKPQVSPLKGTDVTVEVTNLDSKFQVFVGNVEVEATVVSKVDAKVPDELLHYNSSAAVNYTELTVEDPKWTISFTCPAFTEEGYRELRIQNYANTSVSDPEGIFYTDNCPKEGTFGKGKKCRKCPEGAVCPGGNRIIPLAGYWNDGENSGFVMQCEPPEICLGGVGNNCAEGRSGAMCRKCEKDWYLEGNRCFPCPTKTTILGFIVADIFVWMFFMYPFVSARNRVGLAWWVMFIRNFQLLGAIGRAAPTIPGYFAKFNSFLKFLSADVTSIRPECTRPDTFLAMMVAGFAHNVAVYIPGLLMMLLVRAVSLLRMRRFVRIGKRTAAEQRLLRVFWVDRPLRILLMIPYMSMVSVVMTTILPLACVMTGYNRFSVATAEDVRCYVGTHGIMMTVVGGVAFLLIGLIFPIMIYIKLRGSFVIMATDVRFIERFSTFYDAVVPKWRNFWTIDMFTLMGCALGSSALRPHYLWFVHYPVIVLPFLVKFILVLVIRPYRHRTMNILEAIFAFTAIALSTVYFLTKRNLLAEDILKYIYISLLILMIVLGLFNLGYTNMVFNKPRLVDPELPEDTAAIISKANADLSDSSSEDSSKEATGSTPNPEEGGDMLGQMYNMLLGAFDFAAGDGQQQPGAVPAAGADPGADGPQSPTSGAAAKTASGAPGVKPVEATDSDDSDDDSADAGKKK